MAISTSTFLSDSVKFIRDALATGITDPIASARTGRERFVMTSYPQRPTKYPIITVKIANLPRGRHLGHGTDGMLQPEVIEIRVWARNVSERDTLTEQVYNELRELQLTATTGSADNGLYDFGLLSAVPVDEPGDGGRHSMVMEYTYFTILT